MDTTIVSVAADYQVALRRINVSLPIELIEELLDLMGQLKDTAKVRQTDDGRYSVLDFIENVLSKSSARKVWQRLKDKVTIVSLYKFPQLDGRLQAKETPVTNEFGLIIVAYCLPGKLGDRLRNASAQLMLEALAGYRSNLDLLLAQTDTTAEIAAQTATQLKTALTSFPNTLDKLWKTSGIVSKYQVKNAVLRDFVEERDYIWADGILCLNDSTYHILAISFRSLKGADVDALPEIIQLKTREYFRYQADKKMNRRIAQDCEWEQPLLPLAY